MATVGQGIVLGVLYYFVIGLGIFAMSYGGLFEGNNLVQGSFNSNNPDAIINQFNLTAGDVGAWDYVWTVSSGLTDVSNFFFGFGVDLGLGTFGNFMVSIMFVKLPFLILTLFILLAIRGGSS